MDPDDVYTTSGEACVAPVNDDWISNHIMSIAEIFSCFVTWQVCDSHPCGILRLSTV